MKIIRSFPPVIDESSRVLILGSMPGTESLRAGEYYAHPRNIFWRLMGDLVGASRELTYGARIRRLRKSGIALWDVLAACARKGSLDSNIDENTIIVNDLVTLLIRHQRISHVYFNGATAERCFCKHVQPALESDRLKTKRLPSTSPAHATLGYAEKLRAWRMALKPLAPDKQQ